MDTTHLVVGERVRNVIRFSDSDGNARKIENPTITSDKPELAVELVETREWTSTDGSVGTELEVLATPSAPVQAVAKVDGDPLPGDPVGDVFVEFGVDCTSAASGASITTSTIEATT